jgi:hypothetical protein
VAILDDDNGVVVAEPVEDVVDDDVRWTPPFLIPGVDGGRFCCNDGTKHECDHDRDAATDALAAALVDVSVRSIEASSTISSRDGKHSPSRLLTRVQDDLLKPFTGVLYVLLVEGVLVDVPLKLYLLPLNVRLKSDLMGLALRIGVASDAGGNGRAAVSSVVVVLEKDERLENDDIILLVVLVVEVEEDDVDTTAGDDICCCDPPEVR